MLFSRQMMYSSHPCKCVFCNVRSTFTDQCIVRLWLQLHLLGGVLVPWNNPAGKRFYFLAMIL